MDDSLWTHCLRRLEAELPEQHFNTWIRPLQAVEDPQYLRLLAPNRYVVDWVNQNCAARIGELVEETGAGARRRRCCSRSVRARITASEASPGIRVPELRSPPRSPRCRRSAAG